jgi:DNA-binding MarR family transcriptional regulator
VLYDRCLQGHGIEGPQFALLAMVDRAGPCCQAAIGRRFVLDKTTLSRNLKRLEQRGWIAMSAGVDGREKRVALTSAGRRVVAAAKPAWRRAQDQLRLSMRREHWEALRELLDAVTRAAGAARRRHDVNAAKNAAADGRRGGMCHV